jgi:hypothetical protein
VSGPAYRSSSRPPCQRRMIEIVGPPGAGKSSLAGTLSSSGDDVRLVRTYFGLRNLLPWVHAATSLLPLLLSGSFPGPAPIKQRRGTVRIAASHEIVERALEGAPVLLFDQGPLFTMLCLMEAADVGARGPRWQRWWRHELSAWAAALDTAVVLDAPDDVLLERIRARSKFHVLKDRPEQDARKELAKWRALVEDLITEVRAHGEVEVHRLDTGDKPPAEVAAGAMRALGFDIAPTSANDRARSSGCDRRAR